MWSKQEMHFTSSPSNLQLSSNMLITISIYQSYKVWSLFDKVLLRLHHFFNHFSNATMSLKADVKSTILIKSVQANRRHHAKFDWCHLIKPPTHGKCDLKNFFLQKMKMFHLCPMNTHWSNKIYTVYDSVNECHEHTRLKLD